VAEIRPPGLPLRSTVSGPEVRKQATRRRAASDKTTSTGLGGFYPGEFLSAPGRTISPGSEVGALLPTHVPQRPFLLIDEWQGSNGRCSLGGRLHDSPSRVEPVICREPLADSGAHARDIAENACFQLLLVEAVLHQITDTHDALQLVVLDNR
jgi:hypothetical protein